MKEDIELLFYEIQVQHQDHLKQHHQDQDHKDSSIIESFQMQWHQVGLEDECKDGDEIYIVLIMN